VGESLRYSPAVLYGVGLLLAVGVAVSAASIVGQTVSYPTMIVILAAVLVAALVRELVVFRDPLTPAGIVAASGLLLFVLRPLTVMTSGVTSPGAKADSQYFSSALVLAGSAALVQCLIFFSVFFVVYYAASAYRSRSQDLPIPSSRATPPRVINPTVLQGAVLAASAIAVGALGYVILSSGGPAVYFSGLASRSEFLSGKSFFVLGYVPVQVALVANVLYRRRAGLPVWNNWVNLVGVGSLLFCGALAGGRGPLVIGVLLPLIILKQVGPKPFRLRSIAVMAVGLMVLAMSYSVIVRNANFDEGRSLEQLTSDPVGVLLEQLTSGAETRPFDSLIRLNAAEQQGGSFDFQNGATYATAPAWFIPRALWADKPSGGGNTWFTSTYVPRFYGTERVETSLSAIGEGYGNFGLAGVALAGVAVALLASYLTRIHFARKGLFGAAVTVSLTPLLFSVLRGDAYQGGSLTVATVLICGGIYFLASRPAKEEKAVDQSGAASSGVPSVLR
jgi:hypothetical protein